uniref:Uncharacterized protein n=1 Tax=Steinernema glaseri TaxID=37863 RepID=A0A1I7YQF8_9BILA
MYGQFTTVIFQFWTFRKAIFRDRPMAMERTRPFPRDSVVEAFTKCRIVAPGMKGKNCSGAHRRPERQREHPGAPGPGRQGGGAGRGPPLLLDDVDGPQRERLGGDEAIGVHGLHPHRGGDGAQRRHLRPRPQRLQASDSGERAPPAPGSDLQGSAKVHRRRP